MARIAFVINPIHSLNVKKDTTLALVQAALQAQHEVYLIEIHGLYYTSKGVASNARSVYTVHMDCSKLMEKSMDIQQVLELGELIQLDAKEIDIVMMRQDPPVDHQFLATLLLLAQWEKQGVQIVNPVTALLTLNEKLNIMQFPQDITSTLVCAEIETLLKFIKQHNEVVLKPLNTMGGEGIVKVQANDANLREIITKITQSQTQLIMAQKMLDILQEGDKRILFFHGKPLPYALARYPKPGHFLANLAAGGSGEVVPLTKRDKDICKKVSIFCIKNKLAIVGLDVIAGCITEINVTSSTCLREIQTVSQQDYALDFMQSF